MRISRLIELIAEKFKVAPEQVEATRVLLHKPQAFAAVLKSIPPLPKQVLQDPSLVYSYPAAFIQWSKCMHGLAKWDTVPVLSYADYVAQLELTCMPTDIAISTD